MRARLIALVLIGICALTLFAGLNQPPIRESDEAFYAEAGREMLVGGDWITPHYNFGVRLQKPVLFYWFVAATYAVAGVATWTARLWAAMAGLALVLLTFRIGSRFFDDGTGFLAGAITATCFGLFTMARLAHPEVPLAFFITLAIYAGLMAHDAVTREAAFRWLALSAASAGFGFLTKGPIAVVIPSLVIGAVAIRARRLGRVSGAQLAAAIVIFCAIALPWHVAIVWIHGAGYLRGFFLGDNLARFATTHFNRPRPFVYYLPVLAWWMMPWSAFGLLGLPHLRDLFRRWRHLSAVEFTFGAWIILPFLLLTASIGKQPHYAILLIPPIAVVTARLVLSRIARLSQAARRDYLLLSCTVLVEANLLLIAIMLTQLDVLTSGAVARAGLTGLAIVIVATGLLVALIGIMSAYRAIPAAMVLCGVVTWTCVQFDLYGSRTPDPVRQIAGMIGDARRAAEPVAVSQVMVRSLVFSLRGPELVLATGPELIEYLHSPGRVLLVAPVETVTDAELTLGRPLVRLGEVRYFDPTTVRLNTLFALDQIAAVRTVLLVANR